MQQDGLNKFRVFLCIFEGVLLASFQLLSVFHMMAGDFCHGHGAYETGCVAGYTQPGCADASFSETDTRIPGNGVCPAGDRKTHDPATCPICWFLANLSRMLPTEPGKVVFYYTCQGEAAILSIPAVDDARPSAAFARAPPHSPIS